MKRESKLYKIKKVYIRFFWTKCEICGYEFKNEHMWKVIRNYLGDCVEFACLECAPTELELEKHVDDNGVIWSFII